MIASPSSTNPPTRVKTEEMIQPILAINMTNVGSGYDPNSPPDISILGGGGSGATATAIVSAGGEVVGTQITNRGSGYTTSPSVTFDPPSSGTTATGEVESESYIQIWRLIRDVVAGKTPSKNPFYWYREDVCGKLIKSCKIRFQGNNDNATLNSSYPLPFGGFPGAKTFK